MSLTTTRGNAVSGAVPGTSRECLSEFLARLQQSAIPAIRTRSIYGAGRHFLTWLQADGIALDGIDDNVLRRFRRHDCRCVHPQGKHYKRSARRSRQYMAEVSELVRFLEQTGRTAHPGELEQGFRLADDFMDRCRRDGFADKTLRWYRSACRHFLTWLHGARLPMREMAAAPVLSSFLEHECLCPGGYRTLSPPRPGATRYTVPIEQFTRFLAQRGVVPDRLAPPEDDSSRPLEGFRQWLRQTRGIRETSIQEYLRTVSNFLPEFGNDPGHYDAALVRDVLLSRCAGVKPRQAQRIATCIRMYLRYLISQGACSAGLVGAIPPIPERRLASLPRYLPAVDVERAVATCDVMTPLGLRNRAILLLLARLALRAGDIVSLRLDDIDWGNALIRVCGKSKRPACLPLPQDVGDALLDYIERARPAVATDRVFLRSPAPHRPFAASSAISHIASTALEQAAVDAPGPRGAHLFRHSLATNLLRSGATLDAIGTLLRHRSPDTSAIYAKVDNAAFQTMPRWCPKRLETLTVCPRMSA